MKPLHWAGWVAFLLGGVVFCIAISFSRASEGITDESMKWEGGVALAFGLMLFAGPFWLAQLVFSIIASLKSPDWRVALWVWFFAVWLPLVPGLRAFSSPSKGAGAPEKPRTSDFGAKAVMDAAWVEGSEGWHPCLTVPLPMAWPPIHGEPVVWYCYAERMQLGLVDGVEIGAPWARLMLAQGESQPTLKRLLDAMEPLGIQGVRPLDASQLNAVEPTESLVTMIRRADGADEEIIASRLASWRELNGRIAGHPLVAGHFPPV